jgi:hypothetical protein
VSTTFGHCPNLLFYFGSVFEPEFENGSRSQANNESKFEAKKPAFGFVVR